MSKNKNIIIAIILIVVGMIGVLLCAIPSTSKEYKVIKKYIGSINACSFKQMKDCLPVEEVEDMLGIDYEDLWGTSDNGGSKLEFLMISNLSAASKIPDGTKEIKSISLISATKTVNEGTELMSDKTVTVLATVEVTYITSDDKTVSITTTEVFQLAKTSKGYKIISV